MEIAITLSIPKDIVDIYQDLADKSRQSRKGFMEKVLISFVYKDSTLETDITANQNKPFNGDILFEIHKIEAEKCPKDRDTSLGRRVWKDEQEKRISELKKQLK